jgi:hypothetical protein
LYFRSCGTSPTLAKGKIVSSPISVQPVTTECDFSVTPRPSVTSGPTTAKGPIMRRHRSRHRVLDHGRGVDDG